MTMRIAVTLLLASCLAGVGCGDESDSDTPTATLDGSCERSDVNGDGSGSFCIAYTGLPEANEAAVKSGCEQNWGGTYSGGGTCDEAGASGMCTLSGGATGGAESAVILFTGVDSSTAGDDVCGSDGTYADL